VIEGGCANERTGRAVGLDLCVTMFLAVCTALSVCAPAAQPAPPHAHISFGDVTGTTTNGVDAFKGIPYAAPPIGDLRWRPPQPPQPWSASRSAKDYGHSCPQRSPPERVLPSSQGATTSEDCLTLNVWTPTHRPPQPMPVMVWIHGGGNNSGTSAQTYYDGTAFARDGVVLVSFNYRLGALGFFTHPAIKGANFGLQDQLAALQWVKQNIKPFGGNPNNITVFGESAGGTDILTLMSTRKAAGHFQKAIVESAGWWNHVPDVSEGQAAGVAVATMLGLPGASATAAQLRALPVEKLTASSESQEAGPVIDHELLTESPKSAIEHSRMQHIPLIIGTNSNEGSLVAPDAPLTEVAGDLSKADLDKLTQLYGVHDEASKVQWIFRDAHFSMPARWVAASESHGAPVFLYRFEYVASFLARRRTTANHGSEIPFVFATWPDYRLNEADQHMTRTLHECWVAFAKTGRPACPDTPQWPAFSVGSDTWMRFGTDIAPEPVRDRAVLNFLQSRLQN
jgi:para-nitrobenzyl esterase